jgi:hypothetical protein
VASIKLRSCFCLILMIATIPALAATKLNAQIPEAKTKPAGSVSGRVTIGEKPASGILIAVSNVNSSTPMGQTTSDADGNYRIGGLAAGPLNVTPVAPVYVVSASVMSGQGRVVNLAANETVEGIDFKLMRGGVMTGRITDAEGRPVIEERVSLISVDENGSAVRGPTFRPSNFMMYLTDDRGVYRIYGLPAGRYKVSVGDDGRNTGMRTSGYFQRVYYPDAAELNKAGIVDVSEGGETKNIDIKLGRRASTYSVTGRFIEADTGRPLPGIFFSLGVVRQSENQIYVSGSTGSSAPTNSQGEFRLEGVSPGRYVLLINPASSNTNAGSQTFYNDPVPFEVLDGDVSNLEIKAQRGLSISGFVVTDGITDKSVLAGMSRVLVSASVNSVPGELQTYPRSLSSKLNPDGSFLIEGLHPGRITLNVGDYGGPQSLGLSMARIEYDGTIQHGPIDLPPGQNISGVKIFVTRGTGIIHGQLKFEGGTLPPDALMIVSATREGEPRGHNDQVDSRGRFVIRNIPPGTYDVALQLLSFGSQGPPPRGFPRQQRQTVTVTDGSDTEVIFTLDLSRKDGP